ncbi:protein FAM214B-like [Canis lupus familiaris]|uniref:protein FAM214B-like n=1 Tax=Canis lupus familiaris TaxID=9615 RepID=UPI0018F5823E|nr:protein FAM214B-like [Canis lupus familiaris]
MTGSNQPRGGGGDGGKIRSRCSPGTKRCTARRHPGPAQTQPRPPRCLPASPPLRPGRLGNPEGRQGAVGRPEAQTSRSKGLGAHVPSPSAPGPWEGSAGRSPPARRRRQVPAPSARRACAKGPMGPREASTRAPALTLAAIRTARRGFGPQLLVASGVHWLVESSSIRCLQGQVVVSSVCLSSYGLI